MAVHQKSMCGGVVSIFFEFFSVCFAFCGTNENMTRYSGSTRFTGSQHSEFFDPLSDKHHSRLCPHKKRWQTFQFIHTPLQSVDTTSFNPLKFCTMVSDLVSIALLAIIVGDVCDLEIQHLSIDDFARSMMKICGRLGQFFSRHRFTYGLRHAQLEAIVHNLSQNDAVFLVTFFGMIDDDCPKYHTLVIIIVSQSTC